MPPALGEIEELAGGDDRLAKERGGGVCAAVLADVWGSAWRDSVRGRDEEGLAAVEDPGEVVDVVVVAPDLVEFTGDLDAAVVLVLDEHVGGVAADHHDVADGGLNIAAVEGTELADELPGLENI